MFLDKEEEMKKIVEGLTSMLNKKGINVDSAAILNLGKIDKNQEKTIDKAVNDAISKMEKLGFLESPKQNIKREGPLDNKVSDIQKKYTQAANQITDKSGQCYCPECYNFETFEQVLSKRGGTFEKTQVTLGGKIFNIKYWTDGKNEENIMIAPIEKVDSKLSLEELQAELNFAVQSKNYDKAQTIINQINKFKNQKGE